MWDAAQMEKRISELRRRVATAPRNQRGRRRVDRAERAAIVALAQEWRATGSSQRALADRLGLSHHTLSGWVHEQPGKDRVARIKRVEVIEDRAPASSASITLVTESGLFVDGLKAEDVIQIVRALG